MKKLVYAYPFLSRIILAVVLGFMAIVLSGTIYNAIPVKPFFPFVGEVLLLLVT